MNLKELSRILGLSQTTVSRALNGYPEVSERTRQKVLAAANKHGYSANTRAKGLATGRSHAIGHVISAANRHEMVNPIFVDFIAGAGEIYAGSNYEMVLTIVEDANEEQVYRNYKARGTVDGVILHGPKMNDRRIALLREIGLPFVVHGRASGIAEDYSWLDVNNRRAFQRGTEFLLDLGHRRIGLLNGLEDMDFAHRRRAGFEAALTGRGIEFDASLLRSDEMTESFGYQSVTEMLDLDDPPSAFMVSSIISAMGARRALDDRGLRMGRDVSILTYDDTLSYLANGDEVPIFTATRSSVRYAGEILADMLLKQIEDPTLGPVHHLLEAELMVGSSTGPLRT